MATSWVALRQVERQVTAGAVGALQAVRDTSRAALGNWTIEHIITAADWATRDDITDAAIELDPLSDDPARLVSHPQQALLRQLLSRVSSTHGYRGFFIVSLDGTNLASSRDANIGLPSLLFEQTGFLDKILAGNAAASIPEPSDVPLSDATGNLIDRAPTMFVGAPLRDDQGQIIAIFTLRLDPTVGVFDILERGRFGANGETYAVDRSGRDRKSVV